MCSPLTNILSLPAAAEEGRKLCLCMLTAFLPRASALPHCSSFTHVHKHLVSAVLCYVRLPWAYSLLWLRGRVAAGVAAVQNLKTGLTKRMRRAFLLGGGTCSSENVRCAWAVFRTNSCKCQNASWHLWAVYHYHEGKDRVGAGTKSTETNQ